MAKTKIFAVVDADIAKSAGTTDHPVSSSSRQLLECLMQNKHSAVMCPTLRAEWRKHQSLFSQKWMASMIAKKQMKFISPESLIYDFIEKENYPDELKKVCLKDAHLVDAALEEDKYLFSKDEKARKKFCIVSGDKIELKELIWVNPVKCLDFVISHLERGGYVTGEHYLTPPTV